METMTVREPEFYTLFNTFMTASLIYLQKRDDNKELSERKNLRFHKTWMILLKNENSFTSLKEFEELKKWIELRPKVAKQFGSYIGYGHIIAQLPLSTVLLREVYSHIHQFGLEPNQFLINGLYEGLEYFLFSERLHIELTTPLEGTNIETHIQIEDGLQIRDLKKDRELWEEIHLNYPEARGIRNVIIHEFELPKIVEKEIDRFYDLIDYHYMKYFERTKKLIEALRIFKSGNFGALKTIEYSPIIHTNTLQLEGCTYVRTKFSHKKNDYLFTQNDIEKFKLFWHEYNKIVDDENFLPLRLAISKFTDSYEKANFDDRILDFVIILEGLMRRNKKEKSHTLITRIAKFLSNTNVEKEKISKFMTVAYKIRNDVAHAVNEDNFRLDGQQIRFTEFTKDLENYTRMCICKFINLMNKNQTRNYILSGL